MLRRYSDDDLNNLHLQQQADEAFEQGIIDKQSHDVIKSTFPCNLYTPNIFIRIALALLFIFFVGVFIRGNYAYQDVIASLTAMVAALWLCIRFSDSFMALTTYAAFLSCVYYSVSHITKSVYTYLPFILMLASAIIYASQHWLKGKQSLSFYKKCFLILSIATLIGFYASSNVYVVNQLSKSFVSLFWVLSVLIPIAYMIYGFIKKHLLFLRIGFLALIATVVTVHYYYSLLSIEVALIIAGCIFIALGYICLSYFKNGRLGFTARSHRALNKDLINIETLISMQAGSKHAPTQNMQFGGGSSGGAGASGNW